MFIFKIVELAEKQLVGMSIDTTMQTSFQDCPKLWEQVGPLFFGELEPQLITSTLGQSYGVSKMLDEPNFRYWVAVELKDSTHLPCSMSSLAIAAGQYVCCEVESLDKLQAAYHALYMDWPNTQQRYQFDTQGLTFEAYPENYLPKNPFMIYAAVVER